MGRAASVLARRRVAAFVALGAAVLAWFVAAPHLSRVGLWPAVLLASFLVIPATLLLVLVALPLWRRRWTLPVAAVLVLAAFGCERAGWGLPANFAKLGAAVLAGWWFLTVFEQLSWVVLVAAIIPLVDVISVWRGPTRTITAHHFEVYTAVAIAFLLPGGEAAYLGPPDILFYGLFLAAAARWGLRVGWTWLATTSMYGLIVIVATAADVSGLPALPFLSLGFLGANADLIWRRLRPAAPASG